jgi:hypothetical protein
MLAMAAPVLAQPQHDVSGTVRYVDPTANTIHFTDGRIVHLKPGAEIFIDGRRVTLSSVKPGTTVAVSAATSAAGDTSRTTPVAAMHPPVDASGVIASVDQQGKTVTFQDGRLLKVGDGSVWTPARFDSLQPGQQVFINNGRPVAFKARPMGLNERMGTVGNIDSSRGVLMLDDGTLVRVRPGIGVAMGNQRLAITDLRPGDEVIVIFDHPSAAASAQPTTSPTSSTRSSARSDSTGDSTTGGSAMPREAQGLGEASRIDAREILIMRRHQSP